MLENGLEGVLEKNSIRLGSVILGALAPLCMTRKEHIEGRRGLGHDHFPVATGSPQALRIAIRE
jgi:hypothetical protein